MKRTTTLMLIASIASLGALSACGQRGALYLPDESRNVVVTSAPVTESAPTSGADSSAAGDGAADTPAVSPEPTEEQRRSNATAPAR